MSKVNLKINNIPVSVEAGTKILDAAKAAGFNIPTLCYLKDICNDGSCRVCVVEVAKARGLIAACSAVVSEGMEVFTNTPKVLEARKTTIELMLSNHHKRCLSCVRSGNCELMQLSREYNCNAVKYEGEANEYAIENTNPYLVRDNNKCILCRRCVAMCASVQSVGVLAPVNRGFKTSVSCAFNKPLDEVACVACGQCINVCPVGALVEKDDTDKVRDYLADPELHVIAGTAPAVRVALGEEFGYPIGTDVEGKMVSALKMLGFDKSFDIDMTADLTIMEEGTELLHRLKDKTSTMPLITSCSPGWVRYIEFYYPTLLSHLSSCKSPMQMFGAVMKTYYSQKYNIAPEKIRVVGVMPCVAKKTERLRDDQAASGFDDVDAVITTREFAKMIKSAGIDFNSLKDSEFDNPLGEGTTAGLIFGASGGVMEAALRTVSEIVEGKPLEKLDFTAVRGTEGIKSATVTLGGNKIKVCAASGLANAKVVLDEIASGKSPYTFVEIMACPGGCINGGGQPIQSAQVRNNVDVKALRAAAIYKKDKSSKNRKSHENPIVQTLYKDYFVEPGSHKAHKILHTTYKARKKFKD